MSRKSIYLFLGILTASLAGGVVSAQPLEQDLGPDGIVSVEAEHYDDKTVGDNGDEWIEVGPVGIFTGVAGMQTQPDDNTGSRNTDYAARSPRLDYVVNFAKTGTHYVWILASGDDGYSDSCHAGLDGEEIDTSDRMSGWNESYGWSNDTVDSVPSSFEVTTTGVHTLNVWMREDGLIVDKIVLTTNPDFVLEEGEPGPEESLRGARKVASGARPADTAIDIPRDVVLSWTPGESAMAHDVYFGTVFDDVNAASRSNPLGVLVSQGQDGNAYAPAGILEFGQTYYWRVDEVNAAPDSTIFPGSTWSFTTEPFVYPLENITATASSSQAQGRPENTVDGSGLDADDLHSTDVKTMWLSAADGEQPTWIQYEFDAVYKLHEMWVWNYNVLFEMVLGYGFKDVTIEYSENGKDWAVLADVEFAKAPSADGYAPNTTVDLEGVAAKYVKLTANANWGTLTQYGLSEVRFLYIPAQPREPMPASGAQQVSVNATLDWRAGREASSHEVYFSSDQVAVSEGTALVDTVSDATYTPSSLEFGQTYYWKITEVNEAEEIGAWEGDIWSFSTQEYVVVEDFESYTDDLDAGEAIFQTWIDGWENGTGSTVGHLNAPFAEQTIVHGGMQSMPLEYNNADSPWYSETERTLAGTQNWAANGADVLVLHFRGHPVDFLERADGTIVMGAAGTDIADTSDEFRFAYKTLNGDGSMVVRVDSLVERDPWTKAGVMIRETLEPGSRFAGVFITPGNGCRFQARAALNASHISDTPVATPEQVAITAPYWVRLDRSGHEFSGFYSADGATWTAMSWNPQTIQMSNSIRIGLAVTSHNPGNPTRAEFSGVAATGGVTGAWEVATIGVEQPSNEPAQLYVAVADSAGRTAVLAHPDPAATTAVEWQEWAIPLDTFSAAGVNPAGVRTMYIGVGDRDNPQPAGVGLIFIDDIWVGHPAPAVE